MADYSSFPCPSCSAKLRRSEDIVAGVLVKCPRCNTEFTVPEEAARPIPTYTPPGPSVPSLDLDRPPPPREYDRPPAPQGPNRPPPRYPPPEPDEDAPPRERPSYGGRYADNSGNFEVNVGGWLGQSTGRWGEFVGPTIGFVFLSALLCVLVAVTGVMCGIPFLLAFLYAPALVNGPFYAAARCLRRDRWEFNDFFYGFQRWGSLWLLNFLTVALTILIMVPFFVLGGVAGAWFATTRPRPDPALLVLLMVAIWGAAGLVAAYFHTRWMFSWLLVMDQRMDAGKAMGVSWQLTRDKVLPLFGYNILRGLLLAAVPTLCLLAGGVISFTAREPALMFLAMLGAGVAQLFVAPLYFLTYAAAYLGATQQLGPRRGGGDDIDRDFRRDAPREY